MVNTSNLASINTDLREVANRHETAAAVVDTLSRALDTIPVMSAEITSLRRRLTTTRHDSNNLLAAARATLSAQADGEEDPLFYLRDELTAQGLFRAEQRNRERP